LHLVVGDGSGIVEEHHHAVARDVLEGSFVRCDQLAQRERGSRGAARTAPPVPDDGDHADQFVLEPCELGALALEDDRDAERGAVGARARVRVLGIRPDVGDVHELAGERGAARQRRAVDRMRMLLVVFEFRGEAVVGESVQQLALDEPEPSVVAPAEARGRLDDRVQHRLQTFRACAGAQHLAECALLLAQPLELAGEVARVQAAGSRGAIVRPSPLSCSQ